MSDMCYGSGFGDFEKNLGNMAGFTTPLPSGRLLKKGEQSYVLLIHAQNANIFFKKIYNFKIMFFSKTLSLHPIQ